MQENSLETVQKNARDRGMGLRFMRRPCREGWRLPEGWELCREMLKPSFGLRPRGQRGGSEGAPQEEAVCLQQCPPEKRLVKYPLSVKAPEKSSRCNLCVNQPAFSLANSRGYLKILSASLSDR